MSCCGYCSRVFRDNYNLSKHLARLNKCVKDQDALNLPLNPKKDTLVNPKNTLVNPKDTLVNPKNTLVNPKDTLINPKDISKKCKYCMNVFYNKGNMIKHQLICKQKNDPIRLMEIENKIQVEVPDIKTECRFCNKNFCRLSLLNKHLINCTSKEEYHKMLIIKDTKRTEIINQQTTINNTINNNITNNNIVLNFGQTVDNTLIEELIDFLRILPNNFNKEDRQYYLMAGELINKYDRLLMKTPENNNLVIPDSKCLYAEAKIENGWEKVSIVDSLNSSFKDRADRISKKQTDINTANERVFKNETNKEIFKEVDRFAKKGFGHAMYGDSKRNKVKTDHKINKLKNKITVDF